MSSLFKSTRNTRFLPVGEERYIRSDVPMALTEDEVQWLLEKNIRTVVDLRADEEQREKPCCLRNRAGFHCVSLPVTGGNGVPAAPDEVSVSYLAMCDEQMEGILETVLSADTGVLYFCSAGKDRTGVVSALLMRRLGCKDEEIIADYMLSRDSLLLVLEAYAARNQEISLEVITPCERYMREFLARCGQ